MREKIKYPVGIQTFSEIIEDGYLYVDKTPLVHELVNDYKYVFLSRPRRFGKSLLVSTLEAYFCGRKELFDGLAIAELEDDWKEYPVLRFDLSAASYTHPDVLIDKLKAYLRRLEAKYGVEYEEEQLGDRFHNLILAAYRQTGSRVVVLIDEYDKPMLDALHDSPLLERIKGELRGFYSVLKECDEYIRFAMLTGVTKFGKVSIFSGLNNLEDISMDCNFNAICGITEQEFYKSFSVSISEFAQKNGISEMDAYAMFKSKYDGYHFSIGGADVYNPYSTLRAFKTGKLNDYWFETGSPTYLIKIICRNSFNLNDLNGVQRRESSLSNIVGDSGDIVPLLYQAGYLTIKGFDADTQLYTLGLPNGEVSEAFWKLLGDEYFEIGKRETEFGVDVFAADLDRGDAEAFMVRLRSMLASVSSEQEPDKDADRMGDRSLLII